MNQSTLIPGVAALTHKVAVQSIASFSVSSTYSSCQGSSCLVQV